MEEALYSSMMDTLFTRSRILASKLRLSPSLSREKGVRVNLEIQKQGPVTRLLSRLDPRL